MGLLCLILGHVGSSLAAAVEYRVVDGREEERWGHVCRRCRRDYGWGPWSAEE